MAIFHYTVKIVGRSKGKSIISASAYLNGDVMKNEENGRISYYTSKKEVVYTSLMMCENAPQEWQNMPAENIKRFQKSVLYKRANNKEAALEKFKLTFQKQRLSTTLFQMIRSKVFISDCGRFFDTIATFIQTIAGWIVLTGKNVAQISDGISNPVIAGIIYWLIRILICGGCLVGAGIFLAFIGIKIAGLYKKCCWDMITILVILISMAIAIYFGDLINTVLPINLLFLLLLVQSVYVTIRWYAKEWYKVRGIKY